MLDFIYNSSPLLLQNFFCSLYGWNLNKRRFSGCYDAFKKVAIESIDWQEHEIFSYQKKRLAVLIKSASKTPFWKAEFEKYNVDYDSLSCPFSELKKLPFYTKEEIRGNYESIINRSMKGSLVKTSGTTGGGLAIYESISSEQKKWAANWAWRSRFGISEEMWCGYFCGRSVVALKKKLKKPRDCYRINNPGKQIIFSNYHLSYESIDLYIYSLNRMKPTWIHGYPSFLARLAELAMKKGLKLKYRPLFVCVSSETLSLAQKDVISDFFGTPVEQVYGQAEGVATMYTRDNFFEVDFLNSHVNFVETGGGNYRIIGTNITNLAFPIFNYDTGDLASGVDVRNGRFFVDKIDGRKEDYIFLPSGVALGRLDHIFKGMINIAESQIVQYEDLSVCVYYVPRPDFKSKDFKLLKSEFSKRVEGVKVSFHEKESIPRESNGKLRLVKRLY